MALDLGSCCVCEKRDSTVRNLVMLPWKLPEKYRGTGWGCLLCDLSMDGATAVICDSCAKQHRDDHNGSSTWVKFVCAGYPKTGDRIPLKNLDLTDSNVHAHNMPKHDAEEATIRYAS